MTPVPAGAGPRVLFFGVTDTDRCVGCCKLSCRKTPTATPEIDGLGRRVFRSNEGQLVIVVEGKPGESGADAGDALGPLPPDMRPDLQIQNSQPLGNGSRAVCGVSPDGVPGINPPTFDPASTRVTDALNDFACRFEVFSRGAPCTFTDASGDAKLVDNTSTIQFCDLMSTWASFNPGENVVSVRLRDVDGVPGPTAQIVVWVATPTPGP